MEIWKGVPGFSRYEASNTGKLRSLSYKNSGKTVELKPTINRSGYKMTVLLNNEGRYVSITFHIIIALTFLGKKPIDKDEVNHKDGNKLNNSPKNLEYVTRQENIAHSLRNKLQTPFKGSEVGTSKLTEAQVRMIRIKARTGGRFWGRNQIAKELGVSPKHLQDIVNHPDERWSHVLV